MPEPPFEMPYPQQIRFPNRSFPAADLRAGGEGIEHNTLLINDRITKCHTSGGGTVVIPPGDWGIRYEAIVIDTFYNSSPPTRLSQKAPLFRRIDMKKDITCRGTAQAVKLIELTQQPLVDITLENLQISAKQGMTCKDVNDIRLNRVELGLAE